MWEGVKVKQGRTAYRDSCTYRVTTSSLNTNIGAVIFAMPWLASQSDAQITHAIILTDSLNLLQKIEIRDGLPCLVKQP